MDDRVQLASARAGAAGRSDVGVLVRGQFRAALDAPDVRRARSLIADAARDGMPVGRLYVDVVRPALAELEQVDAPRGRLALGIGEAILTDLVSALPLGRVAGTGRAAVLLCRETGIESLDGSVATDFLADDGWTVDRVGDDGPAAQFPNAACASGIELAVAVATGAEDVLRFASMCTMLGRLPDPPVIVVCDFSGTRTSRTAAVLGADVIAHDPLELVRCAAERLPSPGHRRWGVRISRLGDALVLAPTGCLDATSVDRLADVGLTRVGTFSRLVVDLRDLAEIDRSGLTRLAAWPEFLPPGDIELVLLADTDVRRRLNADSNNLPMRVVDALER
jgi:hypothetical protein